MSKEKGKRGEREVAALLKSYGFEARRGQQHSGSPDSPDVVSSLKAAYDQGVHIEVKRAERLNLYKALQQAMEDAGPLDVPVVFHRTNGKEWVVVIRAADFLELLKERNDG